MRRSALQTACNPLVSYSTRGGWGALSVFVDLQGFFWDSTNVEAYCPRICGSEINASERADSPIASL